MLPKLRSAWQQFSRPQQLIGLAIAAILLTGALTALINSYLQSHANRDHVMTELTKTMKTVCIGRYLLDIPAQAEFTLGSADISEVTLVREARPSVNQLAFENKLKVKEEELRALPHKTEGTQLKEVFSYENNNKQRFFLRRSDEKDVRTLGIEGLVRADETEYKVIRGTSTEYLNEGKKIVSDVSRALQSRPDNSIPISPGFCISGAIMQIDGKRADGYSESVAGGFKLEDWSLSFGILTETSLASEPGQMLFDRMDKGLKLAEKLPGGLPGGAPKAIRRGLTQVDGRKGQELIDTFTEKGISYLNAEAEIYGDGSSKLPTFELSMTVTKAEKPDPSDKRKVMSQEEALALWDVVLKSIRPRPGAF
jgi:Tle cognate immunity protein 4 C-terminal domain/Tle cognate immunity protein 4 N-terminal domain